MTATVGQAAALAVVAVRLVATRSASVSHMGRRQAAC